MFNFYDKFSYNFKKVVQRAAWLCLNKKNNKKILPEHLFLGIMLVPESLAYQIMLGTGIITKKENKKHTADLYNLKPDTNYEQVMNLSMDPKSTRILETAGSIALKLEHKTISTIHLLAAMLQLKTEPLINQIKKRQKKEEALKKALQNLLHNLKNQPNVNLDKNPKKRNSKIIKKTIKKKFKSTPALDHFAVDLTSAQIQKKISPLIGREEEIKRIINILSRHRKNNPLLLGEPGVGKTAIIEGLAQKIYHGKAPDILANKRILNLDLNAIVAGTIYRGEFENRLKQIIEDAKNQDDIILFIDEIHNLIGAGSAAGSLDAANILKPYLSRGEITCIGATTLAEYKAHFEPDATLNRRFQTVIINEPSPKQTLNILKGIRKKMQKYHAVEITDQALEEAINLSERFMPNKFLPDKAIDLIDETASKIKVEKIKDKYAHEIRLVKQKLKNLTAKKENAVTNEDFSQALELKKKEEKLINKLEKLSKKSKKNLPKKVGKIDKKNIIQTVTNIVKIPFLQVANLNKKRLLNLENILGKKIIGQEKVIKKISNTLRRSQTGLADPKRPLASFIFLGPSGVGKTETAKTIASEIFGDKNALIRINMSEFQESFNISKLIGAPAGYVGYKDQNQLADRVRSKPYCVVLFDEMEKAHPDIFNLLLQVLEDGYLVDSNGKQINFKNTIIILTSNIGLKRFNKAQNLGFSLTKQSKKQQVKEKFKKIKENIINQLQENFPVEFLNRIDKTLVFEPLTPETLIKIVELNLQELNKKLIDKKLQINFTKGAKKKLAKIAFSPDDGARSIRRVIQEKIEEPLAEKILQGILEKGDKIKVKISGKKIVINKSA